MAETYCGKLCEECTSREELSCPGCQNGPGRRGNSTCMVAVCCREKGHSSCNTCCFYPTCGKMRDRDTMPNRLLRYRQEEQAKKERVAKMAAFNARWMMILFFLVIPDVVVSILTSDAVVGWIPEMYWPGHILQILCLIASGGILLILAKNNHLYRTAGICGLVSGGVNILITLVSNGETQAWSLLLTLPAAALSMYGGYCEYKAHADTVADADEGMAENWRKLWKWYMITIIGMFGSILVMLILPIIGILTILAASIGSVVVGIAKLVYLYQTAIIFKNHIP